MMFSLVAPSVQRLSEIANLYLVSVAEVQRFHAAPAEVQRFHAAPAAVHAALSA
jgi:hypothetical protein